MSARRSVLLIAVVAVAAAGAGYAASWRMHAPDDALARAEPPEAQPVTVPVARQVIEQRVVVRGDAVFDGAVDVSVDTTALPGSAVVTGTPVELGATIGEGDVLIEIADRPLIVLGGEVPTYRSMGPGTSGDDVVQLEVALARLGHDPGVVDDVYDASTAEAAEALYRSLGYAPPEPAPEVTARLHAATEAMAAAAERFRLAAAALGAAMAPPPRSAVLSADAAVAAAQRAVDAAIAAGDGAARAAADEQLAIARAQRDELLAPSDTAAVAAEAAAASDAREAAGVELQAASTAAATPFPAAEVAFVGELPRRIDALDVVRGDVVDGTFGRLSGADLVVRAELGSADRAIVDVGAAAHIEGAGVAVDGVVARLDDDADTGSSVATIAFTDLTDAQVEALSGVNVKVTIPVAATDGEVLAVPIAAVSAAGNGSSRVEVLLADGSTLVVPVEVGLVADGLAEVIPQEGGLDVGTRVVVGR